MIDADNSSLLCSYNVLVIIYTYHNTDIRISGTFKNKKEIWSDVMEVAMFTICLPNCVLKKLNKI
jgi:hypothetical protein